MQLTTQNFSNSYISKFSIGFGEIPRTISNVENKKTDKSNALLYSLAGLAVLGIGTCYAAKKSVKTFSEALEHRGLEIKDGVAVIKKTGERFTGEIKRNTMFFGIEREYRKYNDGIIQEKLISTINEKEYSGEFFINGKLYYRFSNVSRGQKSLRYSASVFVEDSPFDTLCSCYSFDPKFSIVENARNCVKATIEKYGGMPTKEQKQAEWFHNKKN